MDKLTEDAVREIEQIHSSWIEFEVAGEDHSLMALCADDIELWPPDAQPVLGRVAVSAQLARGTTRIHGIGITDRRIRGSNEIAYLTAGYKTTFSSAEDSTPRQALGSHLWILEKRAGGWVVTLVSWSVWGCAAISGTRREKSSIAFRYELYVTGNLEAALKTNELWVQTYPRDYNAELTLGVVYGELGDDEKALNAAARKALELLQANTEAYF